jgi:hypothetical protein
VRGRGESRRRNARTRKSSVRPMKIGRCCSSAVKVAIHVPPIPSVSSTSGATQQSDPPKAAAAPAISEPFVFSWATSMIPNSLLQFWSKVRSMVRNQEYFDAERIDDRTPRGAGGCECRDHPLLISGAVCSMNRGSRSAATGTTPPTWRSASGSSNGHRR